MRQPKPGWHTLRDIDPAELTATCAICGPVRVIYKARKNEYRCWVKYREQQRDRKRRARAARPKAPRGKHRSPGVVIRDRAKWTYRSHKVDVCGRCGFVPEHPCQLDVDHIVPKVAGGSDDPSNLQTLCANCHRLKSYEERKSKMPPPPGQPLTLW